MAHGRRLQVFVALGLLLAGIPGALAAPSSITITHPSDGATVEGVVQVEGTAHDDAGINLVQVRVDSGAWGAADSVSGTVDVTWSEAVDTSTLTNGVHTLSARARNDGGEMIETSVQVTVANAVSTDLRITAFAGETGLAGTTTLHLSVANDGAPGASGVVARFEFLYNGAWELIAAPAFDIAAGGTVDLDQDWESLTKVGKFDVRVLLDPDGSVPETDESNNAAASTAAFWTDAVQGEDLLEPVVPTLPNPAGPVTHYALMLGPLVTDTARGPFDIYGPHYVVIRQGDSIVWINVAPDLLPHTATRLNQDSPKFDTGPVASLALSQPIQFTEAGTFRYYCKLHLGFPPTATIVVLASA